MSTETHELDSNEHFLLDWLGKEDHSSYGECHGRLYDRLDELGLVKTVHTDSRGELFNRVALSDAGIAMLREMGPHPLSRP